MKKIIIGGIGGTPSENVVKSLREAEIKEELIGIGSEPYDMLLSSVEKKYQVPYAGHNDYNKRLFEILNKEKPDFIHFQNDIEIYYASLIREKIKGIGTKVFMPRHEVIENCVDKSKSYNIWSAEGVKVPKTILVKNEHDLKRAFDTLGSNQGKIWLRYIVGGGGKGALPTDDYEFAKHWIDRYNGWGQFTAAELLSDTSVTWLSIWYQGELVVAQTRKRNSWNFGNRTLSGVTGITHVGETYSNETVDKTALDAILSIDKKPNGIYGVDMTYDMYNIPNVTEINISRFFTTVYFFTKAGLNMPEIYKNIALYDMVEDLDNKINPLPNGLLWIRGMDYEPLLIHKDEVKDKINLL